MRPPKQRDPSDFERIKKYDEWIPGEIEEVRLDETHEFTFQGKTSIAEGIRLKFKLSGHEFGHYSRWMRYSFGEKSNLYTKYLRHLVENAQPDMDFDLDMLKGMKIKTMWSLSEDGKFDNLEQIRPLGKKIANSSMPPDDDSPETVGAPPDEEAPF